MKKWILVIDFVLDVGRKRRDTAEKEEAGEGKMYKPNYKDYQNTTIAPEKSQADEAFILKWKI